MAEDSIGFRSDVHTELVDLAATYKLPLLPEGTEPENPSWPFSFQRSRTSRVSMICVAKKVAMGRGSIGHRLILAALEIDGMEGQ
jgi:hypothetical protein